jgi:dienelactone hydrolase
MKNPVLALATASIIFGCAAHAAGLPPGFSPEAVAMTLPEEGAPKAEVGPYAVTSESAFGNDGLVVYRPAELGAFPKKDTLPVIVWGNGGCAVPVGRHAGFIETIVSHGFVVISTAAPPGAPRRVASREDMKAGIDWAQAENARAGSPLAGKLAMHKVAAMGQSCGGRIALEIGADPRVATVIAMAAGLDPDEPELLTNLHGPLLLLNGGDRDFMHTPSKAAFETIDKLPVFYGSRHGAGHSSTIYHPGGGEFANVAWHWLVWQLKGDRHAAAMFVGKKCALCTNENWDVGQKRLQR